jgi:hypothetical protein
MLPVLNAIMRSELKSKEYCSPEENIEETKVNVTRLVHRLNQEKKKERHSNIVLSIAAVSAISVFGIILSI